MGLTNLKIMIPFCRRLEEARKVIEAMAQHGIKRGERGLEIFMMCEIPNNVILIDQFSQLFDGFSIGSNDLTQLTLGVDRDSDIVAFDFDERDPGLLKMLTMAVVGARRNNRHVGICGEAPANYPEIARFLTGLGIDSISVNPSSLLRTMTIVREAEQDTDKSRCHLSCPSRGAFAIVLASSRRCFSAGDGGKKADHRGARAISRTMLRCRICRRLNASKLKSGTLRSMSSASSETSIGPLPLTSAWSSATSRQVCLQPCGCYTRVRTH